MVEFEMRLGVGTEMLVIVDFVWFLCPYRMKTLVEGGQSNCLQTL